MFSELCDVLQWPPNSCPPRGKLFLVTDTVQAPSDFVVLNFVAAALRSKERVCVVGLQYNLQYYTQIAKKMGMNLPSFMTTGHFKFVDPLTSQFSYASSLSSSSSSSTTSSAISSELHLFDKSFLRSLYNGIKSAYGFQDPSVASQPSGSMFVVVDSLNILLSAQPSLASRMEVVDFVTYLTEFCRQQQQPASLLVGVHSDIPDDEAIMRSLEYRASCVVSTRHLEAGMTKEVHGELSVTLKTLASNEFPHTSTWHYHVGDTMLRVFRIGSRVI
jgi:KaiC/GvpD/RAD55 family RecA-like ATPase